VPYGKIGTGSKGEAVCNRNDQRRYQFYRHTVLCLTVKQEQDLRDRQSVTGTQAL
jgi:hypothetical protein